MLIFSKARSVSGATPITFGLDVRAVGKRGHSIWSAPSRPAGSLECNFRTDDGRPSPVFDAGVSRIALFLSTEEVAKEADLSRAGRAAACRVIAGDTVDGPRAGRTSGRLPHTTALRGPRADAGRHILQRDDRSERLAELALA